MLVDRLDGLPADPLFLYIDLEGPELSRKGSVSLTQILPLPKNHVYLTNVYELNKAASTTAGKDGKTLRNILESATIPKVFFDVRNDRRIIHPLRHCAARYPGFPAYGERFALRSRL